MKHINKIEALRYMGYHGNISDNKLQQIINDCESLLCEVITERYVYRVFPINDMPFKLEGNDIKKHLFGCQKAAVFAVTIGSGFEILIRQLESDAVIKAVVADALASAAVEQLCDIAEKQIKDKYKNSYFTQRFSPGYGDFPIDIQGKIISVLDAEKTIGLSCSKNKILIPRKSVTAFIGISEHPIEHKRLGCSGCVINDKCEYRKRGTYCENS